MYRIKFFLGLGPDQYKMSGHNQKSHFAGKLPGVDHLPTIDKVLPSPRNRLRFSGL